MEFFIEKKFLIKVVFIRKSITSDKEKAIKRELFNKRKLSCGRVLNKEKF